jgi:hypothetical protein
MFSPRATSSECCPQETRWPSRTRAQRSAPSVPTPAWNLTFRLVFRSCFQAAMERTEPSQRWPKPKGLSMRKTRRLGARLSFLPSSPIGSARRGPVDSPRAASLSGGDRVPGRLSPSSEAPRILGQPLAMETRPATSRERSMRRSHCIRPSLLHDIRESRSPLSMQLTAPMSEAAGNLGAREVRLTRPRLRQRRLLVIAWRRRRARPRRRRASSTWQTSMLIAASTQTAARDATARRATNSAAARPATPSVLTPTAPPRSASSRGSSAHLSASGSGVALAASSRWRAAACVATASWFTA